MAERRDDKPIWEVARELADAAPPEALERVPPDLGSEHDHYLYGTPRRGETVAQTRTRHYLRGDGIGIDWYLPGEERPAASVDYWFPTRPGAARTWVTLTGDWRVPPREARRMVAAHAQAVALAERLERGEITPDDALREYGGGAAPER